MEDLVYSARCIYMTVLLLYTREIYIVYRGASLNEVMLWQVLCCIDIHIL